MRRVLAIDTSGENGGLAIASEGAGVEELPLRTADGFAHVLFPSLAAFLDRLNLSLAQIDAFAAAAGPGSFTGVRVALSAAKGLAAAQSKPLFAVSNLEALASHGTAARRAVLLDARRGQVFGALYDASLVLLAPETVTGIGQWLAGLPEGELQFVAQDASLLAQAAEGIHRDDTSVVQAPPSLAAAVATVALSRFLSGATGDPALADANYVRRSDAELNWQDV